MFFLGLNLLIDELIDEDKKADEIIKNDESSQKVIDDETSIIEEIINNIKALEFTVTYKDRLGNDYDVQTVRVFEAAVVPANPTEKGYTFKKWNGEANFVVKDVEITSTWDINVYTITYKLGNGEINGNNPTTYTVEDTITFNNASKTGYTFVKWVDENNDEVTGINKGTTGDIELTPVFKINTYKITYNDDGSFTITGSPNNSGKAASFNKTIASDGYPVLSEEDILAQLKQYSDPNNYGWSGARDYQGIRNVTKDKLGKITGFTVQDGRGSGYPGAAFKIEYKNKSITFHFHIVGFFSSRGLYS